MTTRRARLGVLTLVLLVLAAGCGSSDEPVAAPGGPAASSAPGSTATTRRPATTLAPTTTTPAPPPSEDPSTSVSPSSSSSSTIPGQATTTTLIPAGTSAAEKAWCAQAKPVSNALNNLFVLTPAELETLVNQANALVPSAPAALQPHLTILHDIGAKFLAAVKAGQATISVDGITQWAAVNLTAKQTEDFLASSTAVTSYINRTC